MTNQLDPNTEAHRIQKAYQGETMTDPIETTATDTTDPKNQPTIAQAVAGLLPIEVGDDNVKLSFALMADGTVRWVEMRDSNDTADTDGSQRTTS